MMGLTSKCGSANRHNGSPSFCERKTFSWKQTSQAVCILIKITSWAFKFSKIISMTEVTFSCDYYYYCQTACFKWGAEGYIWNGGM